MLQGLNSHFQNIFKLTQKLQMDETKKKMEWNTLYCYLLIFLNFFKFILNISFCILAHFPTYAFAPIIWISFHFLLYGLPRITMVTFFLPFLLGQFLRTIFYFLSTWGMGFWDIVYSTRHSKAVSIKLKKKMKRNVYSVSYTPHTAYKSRFN